MAMIFNNSELRPHPSVRSGIEGYKKTAFTGIEFFENKKGKLTTLEKIGSQEFNKIAEEIEKVGKMKMSDFFNAFNKMKILEEPHQRELEILALKKVTEQFGLPKTIANKIHPKLTKVVTTIKNGELYVPTNYNIKFTKEELQIIKQNVEKRKIQNTLMMGAGFRAHTTFKSIKDDLDAINPKLFPLYEKTMPNVSLNMWEIPIEDMMNLVVIMGASELKRGQNEKIEAHAESVIFPILLHETAKVAMELLFANYVLSLSKDYGVHVAAEILKKADVFEEEVWLKRIGPTLWGNLHNLIDYIIIHEKESDYTLVAFLLSDISKMKPKKFTEFMNLVVYDGEKAIKVVSSMIDEIENDLKRDMEVTTSNYNEMSFNELEFELKKAQKEERFEDASKILKIIKKF